ncbi:MAG: hypothetical protein AAFW88_03840 [Pseudomonadota bacterium]
MTEEKRSLKAIIHNERRKLRATFFNGVAIALVALGVARPFFDSAEVTNDQLILMLSAVSGAAVLHLLANRILGRMKSED